MDSRIWIRNRARHHAHNAGPRLDRRPARPAPPARLYFLGARKSEAAGGRRQEAGRRRSQHATSIGSLFTPYPPRAVSRLSSLNRECPLKSCASSRRPSTQHPVQRILHNTSGRLLPPFSCLSYFLSQPTTTTTLQVLVSCSSLHPIWRRTP